MLLVHPNARKNLNLYRIRCLSQILSLLLDEFEWLPWLSSVFSEYPLKFATTEATSSLLLLRLLFSMTIQTTISLGFLNVPRVFECNDSPYTLK